MCFAPSCSLLFLKCGNSAGSPWEFLKREPKTQQLQCTESRSHDTFVLGKGIYPVLGEARSEISASALQLGTVSAGGKAHHQRLIKDLYPFRHVFSHFQKTISPAFCWELFKVREWHLSPLFCVFLPIERGNKWRVDFKCLCLASMNVLSPAEINMPR